MPNGVWKVLQEANGNVPKHSRLSELHLTRKRNNAADRR